MMIIREKYITLRGKKKGRDDEKINFVGKK